MPLYTCPQCGANVPDQAPTCPRCGLSTQGLAPTGAWQPQAMAPKKGMGAGLIILIVLAVTIVPIVGILAVLSIYGTRKYIANAKTAEARNSLGQIAKDAAVAYEREELSSDGTVVHRICPSASSPVPADRATISARKYQSSTSDWEVDKAKSAGFACLRFEMSAPQYYQYEYIATATGFIARAHGDLNGDGVFSTFEIRGEVQDGQLRIAPTILETNPEE